MKNVRLFYKKKGRLRFVSHLDMTRLMGRIIKKSGLPVWYTEGFNPHIYMTFALPLSLGYESDYDILDIRLTDDAFELSRLPEILNAISGEYLHFFAAAEPVLKASAIASARYEITFEDQESLLPLLKDFLKRDTIICQKKTKKGELRELDIAAKIADARLESRLGNTVLCVSLPAGSTENLNPELLLSAFFENEDQFYCYDVLRTAIFSADGSLFK